MSFQILRMRSFLSGPKHDLKLPGSTKERIEARHARVVSQPGYSLLCGSTELIGPRLALPNRPVRRDPVSDFPSFEEMEACIQDLKVQIGPLVPSEEARRSVIRLLYQYKHLNSIDLADLPATDLIIHRVKLVPGTRPYSVKQKRWPRHMEWWLRKLVQDGIRGGVYERTDLRDGRMSAWNARAVLVDKVENSTPQDETRMTYDYSHVIEELPGTHIKLISGCHDYLFDPRHGCYITADLKHAYSTVEVHSDDRHYFSFTIFPD